MSTNLAYSLPSRPRQAQPSPVRRVEVIATRAQRKARPRAFYAVVTVAGFFAIFAAQLLMSMILSQGAYEIAHLQSQQRELGRTEAALVEQLNLLGSTQHLAESAAGLGMAPSANASYLDLASGAIFAAPSSQSTAACGASCDLVPNALLDSLAPSTAADATAPARSTASLLSTSAESAPAATPQAPASPSAGLPAPVTH